MDAQAQMCGCGTGTDMVEDCLRACLSSYWFGLAELLAQLDVEDPHIVACLAMDLEYVRFHWYYIFS